MKSTIIADYKEFADYLHIEEKSKNTIEKYLRDVKTFLEFVGGNKICKEQVIAYKNLLAEKYEITSANSMIAAVNAFLRFLGRAECCVKQFRLQRKVFCAEERELTKGEYLRLINTARHMGNERLALVLQTIGATGIRVSELASITVEAVRSGKAIVSCKNKTRTIFIVRDLQKKLLCYAQKKGIITGCLFVTRTGKPMSRSNVWREMKSICKDAGVSPEKVFPHNLRHLFARVFYEIEKDIAKLADLLGHSSINTTRIYILTTGAEHRHKIERLGLVV